MVGRKALPIVASELQNEVSLSLQQEDEALIGAIISYVIGKIGSVFLIVGFLSEWQKKRDGIKQAEILKRLRKDVSELTVEVSNVTNLIRNSKGLILFNKIIFLVRSIELEDDDFGSFAELLSAMLINVSNRDFETLFGKISYLVSRIEKLSPQALFLLRDSHNWPKDSVGGTTMSGYTLSGEGLKVVAKGYLREKQIEDESIKSRVIHAFGELQSGGYMIFSPDDKRAVRTEVANEIYEYLLKRLT